MFATASSKKRSRVDDDDTLQALDSPFEKRSRPTTNPGDTTPSPWAHRYHDSVLSTPVILSSSSRPREPPKYDSEDEQSSSEISEPGSPQDISMSSGDEGEPNDSIDAMNDTSATFSQSPEDVHHFARSTSPNPWANRLQTHRVPTPIVPLRSKANGVKTHIRQRHPQEIAADSSTHPRPTNPSTSTNKSTTHLSVPSPILESADFPTPPSAAEAAGSQLSQLSVSDVEMLDEGLPVIAIERAKSREGSPEFAQRMNSGGGGGEGIVVRRQRQRSGALSGGESVGRMGGGGMGGNLTAAAGNGGGKRGFSIGYRPDCEKCRDKVPGHMNHFWAA